jgi:tRNA (cmo5U34)-methyltransferase
MHDHRSVHDQDDDHLAGSPGTLNDHATGSLRPSGTRGDVVNSWSDEAHSARYLARADVMPHRSEGDAVLVGDLAAALPGRILDLGCGDGRLTELVLDSYPGSSACCLDFSPTMLDAARARIGARPGVEVLRHDLGDALPLFGPFDAVVSSLAIHHVDDDRKQALLREVAGVLVVDGVFCNLDVVASPTAALHTRWRDEMGVADDPSDLLTDMAVQLAWMRADGFDDVDCIWKWRSMALMRGRRT